MLSKMLISQNPDFFLFHRFQIFFISQNPYFAISQNPVSQKFVNSQSLEAKDITSSENFVITLIQREHFQSEIDFLSGISKQSTLYISQFNLFIDEHGLLGCRTRLHYTKCCNRIRHEKSNTIA